MKKSQIITLAVGIVSGALLMVLLFFIVKGCSETPANNNDSSNDHIETAQDTGSVLSVSSKNEEAPDWNLKFPSRKMSGNCTISGTIMDIDSKAVKGAVVRLRLLDEPWISANVDAEAVTKKDGSYSFKGLTKDASYQVFAYAKGYSTAALQGAECGTKTDLYMERGAVLKIKFVDDQGRVIPYVKINIGGSSLWPNRVAMAGVDGTVELPGLKPGFYSFTASKEGLGFALLEPIELAEDDEIEIEAQLASLKPITVTVEDGDGQAVSDAIVTVIPEGIPLVVEEYITDSEGKAVINGASIIGSEITVLADGFIKSVNSRVLPGSDVKITLNRGAILRGYVETPQGERVAGAMIDVRVDFDEAESSMMVEQRQFIKRSKLSTGGGRPMAIPLKPGVMWPGPAEIPLIETADDSVAVNDKNPLPWEPTNINGEFIIDGLPYGQLSIGATHNSFVNYRRATINLSPGVKMDPIPIIMKRGVSMVIRVVSRGGHPVENAVVTIFNTDGDILKTSETAGDGYATIEGLPGEFRIEAGADDFVSVTRRILGTPGHTVDVTVNLPDADKILKGVVSDKNGLGVEGVTIEALLNSKGLSQTLNGITESDGTFNIEGAGDGLFDVKAIIDGEISARAKDVTPGTVVHLVVENRDQDEAKGVSNLAFSPGVFKSAPQKKDNRGDNLPTVPYRSSNNITVKTNGQNLQPLIEPNQPGGDSSFINESGGSYHSEFGQTDQLVVSEGYSGAGSLPITLTSSKGMIVVSSVTPGSQVAVTGLKKGAQVLKIDGNIIKSVAAAKNALKG
ncbi:MAG: carboxypeptidase regulatory-like domain-containing protein, partial [Deltaproteobacteria bacterium]|nr:carboxypeptidase regulatory-like domain-containing protein [Deltaproteobacteria bacterium]